MTSPNPKEALTSLAKELAARGSAIARDLDNAAQNGNTADLETLSIDWIRNDIHHRAAAQILADMNATTVGGQK